MRRHFLILAVFSGLVYFVLHETSRVILFYYLVAPLWLFPIYYFYREKATLFLIMAAASVAALHVWFFIREPYFRVPSFLGVQLAILVMLIYYFYEYQGLYDRMFSRKEDQRKNLEALQGKYQLRLNSLHHLEAQVGSLMGLFELARDFSECMDFETLASFLVKKLKPELTFKKMQILLLPKPGTEQKTAKNYEMSPEGVKIEERELISDEAADFEAMKTTKAMIRNGDRWSFPIMEGSDIHVIFAVEGIHEDDLARVEVLSAYLVLLIKKIKLYETVRELAIIDELTQVFVRHHFLERLDEELKRSIRFNLPMAVLMLDIDHFKRYNDEFGHLVGDATLKEVADLLKTNLRRVDLVGRYGGEEFIVAMPETKAQNAMEVAERIRSSIARYDFHVYNVKTKVTVSQGVAEFHADPLAIAENLNTKEIVESLIRRADMAMYRAKEEGRNRVCFYKGR